MLEDAISAVKITVEERLERLKDNWCGGLAQQATIPMQILRIRDAFHARAREILDEKGLIPAEFDVLVTLRASGKPYQMTPTQLARAVLLTSGGMTKSLNRLEAQGFIERCCFTGDRRSRIATLTESGRFEVELLLPRVLESHQEVISGGLTADEQAEFRRLLTKVLCVCE